MSEYLDRYFKVVGRRKAGIAELQGNEFESNDICKNCVSYTELQVGGRCDNRKFRQLVQPVAAVQSDLFEENVKLSLSLDIRIDRNFSCKFFKT